MNPLRPIATAYRAFEHYVPWPLLLIIGLTVIAFLFGYLAP